MNNLQIKMQIPKNELSKRYNDNSIDTKTLKVQLKEMSSKTIEIPLIIGGKKIYTGKTKNIIAPHDHNNILAVAHLGGINEVQLAIDASIKAKNEWVAMSWESRISIFLKAAELISTGPYRNILNAATMLGQSKTIDQAEIDSACELIDFYRFNSYFYEQMIAIQPESVPGVWNKMEYRPLEGFVFAVTPFNFTSIAGNLPVAPAMVGNTVLWKPASTALYSAHFLMKLWQEAGIPDGIINMVPGAGAFIGDIAINNRNLAGVHFTGSTKVFNNMWSTVGKNITSYKSYPRLVGETGGKDFIIAHPSADYMALAVALVHGAFEYQGQKCSAVSRAYIPSNLWSKVKDIIIPMIKNIKVGNVQDFSNFLGAVIDRTSFNIQKKAIDEARIDKDASILVGGEYDDREGYFVYPTIIETTNPYYKTMCNELFGPILTIFIFDEAKWEETLDLVDKTSPYALTGAVFSQDRFAIEQALVRLYHSAGNFYINDKPTGAIVGQQPFGGGRMSGTNDKAGSVLNIQRWVSPRTIKETFVPSTSIIL